MLSFWCFFAAVVPACVSAALLGVVDYYQITLEMESSLRNHNNTRVSSHFGSLGYSFMRGSNFGGERSRTGKVTFLRSLNSQQNSNNVNNIISDKSFAFDIIYLHVSEMYIFSLHLMMDI